MLPSFKAQVPSLCLISLTKGEFHLHCGRMFQLCSDGNKSQLKDKVWAESYVNNLELEGLGLNMKVVLWEKTSRREAKLQFI